MARRDIDSATLIAADERAKAQGKISEAVAVIESKPVLILDADHGPSIKCPDIYEALIRKGYSKEKAARISNSRC
jgi:hypothetical protein